MIATTKQLPLTPYAGTSGWSGSDTSRERAERQDKDGTTGKRQRAVLQILEEYGAVGCTWKDIADRLGIHHGSASGNLSVLHKDGLIVRLAEKRERSKVYVLPKYVAARATEAHQSNRHHTCPNCGHNL